MTRYLVIYHGSEMPHDLQIMAQAKAAFEQWVGEVGDAVVDPGAPLRMVAQVSKSGADDPVDVSGYSIIEASTAEEAVALLQTHPLSVAVASCRSMNLSPSDTPLGLPG